MPSLTNLVLALAALTSTYTLAAPATLTTTNTQPALSKRFSYHPSLPGERDDYCGEANPQYSYGPSTPLAADCQATYQPYPGPGYWLVSAGETNAATDQWVRLAASGTCAFEVRLSEPGANQPQVDFRFGTNDLRFYTKGHASEWYAQDGRVSVRSGVWCSSPADGMVTVHWRIVHA
ncbi:hypothetical protein N658DRAFT_501686 [Parathielavia hyrcaniae]|uniref:Ecp2 effector protein-like domain-containing protein n=1 Tax=Parathielavia hyrcaniae TaxID=113614 RepID=A0AAN6PRF6_9PEZI|nr:hypothetical protein N658DRAFT_501686 [Parathielavia hyrcaniae]